MKIELGTLCALRRLVIRDSVSAHAALALIRPPWGALR